MLKNIFVLVIAPIIVGVAVKLFSYWLEKKDNQK
ncbi:MAG: type I toxin-antitoxin system Fst family toxin [Lactobacillaceae bacterium]|nr:type I toxin-antitoxin system Fst family toxin [Bombilactobacillus mellis]NUF99245.1 type I toxin-antitoxin system Fst family toxin [Bombilactobacillus mellis]